MLLQQNRTLIETSFKFKHQGINWCLLTPLPTETLGDEIKVNKLVGSGYRGQHADMLQPGLQHHTEEIPKQIIRIKGFM